MTFATIVVRGLARRPVRTGLTLVGIAIGIAAVVALVGISRGFEKGWATGMKARGTDIVVSNMGSSLTPTTFDAAARDRIAHLPHVEATSALLVQLMGVENASMVFVSGREWGGYEWGNLKLISGRMPRDAAEPAVVLGRTAADMLQKKVGDPLQLETRELRVVGIADGGALVENGSIILSLPLLQEILGNPGKINVIDVRVTPATTDADLKNLMAQIDRLVPEARAMKASDHIGESQGYRFVRAMSWGTSLLAVFVGVLGVMNTMLMAVFERTQEICTLLALGWRRRRIVRMVLWESTLLGLLGGAVGVVLGIVVVKALAVTPALRGFVEPDLAPDLLLLAVALAVLVGVISGIYPAWRSTRLTPALALQI
jgi:putative ABC transport system permease protein